MDTLIDFIFENLFILIIIGGVVYKYISNQTPSDQHEEKREKENNKPDTSLAPSLEDVFESLGDMFSEERQKEKPEQEVAMASSNNHTNESKQLEEISHASEVNEGFSTEEQRQQQIDRLAEQMKTTTAQMNEQLGENSPISDISKYGLRLHEGESSKNTLKERRKKLKKQLQRNLEKKEWINGIIMAEILGPPRARKPYESVITERVNYKKKKAISKKF
ncbi:MAG TPA: hypothetical protein VF095_00710 [Bacillota bacterium]